MNAAQNANALKNKENVSSANKVSFKTGSQLPSLSDELPGINEAAKSKPKVKFNEQFDEAFDDDFSDGDDMESPNEE